MSCCRCNFSIGKALICILLLLLCVLIVAALPDLRRYSRMNKM